MLTFDARLTLRLTGRRERVMSDQWIEAQVKRIKDREEQKRRTESYELLKEQQIAAREYDLFREVEEAIKVAIERLNQHFPKRFVVGRVHYEEMEISTSLPDVALKLRHEAEGHALTYY